MKRSDELLLLIDERCDVALDDKATSGDGCGMHWVPLERFETCKALGRTLFIYGPGDQSAIRSLVRKSLVVPVGQTHGYAITQSGRLRAQELG